MQPQVTFTYSEQIQILAALYIVRGQHERQCNGTSDNLALVCLSAYEKLGELFSQYDEDGQELDEALTLQCVRGPQERASRS